MTSSNGFRVTLLGTGVPIPSPDRFGPATLIEAGDQKLLIDAGRGAAIRLYQLGVPIGRIDALLLTHYHSDHTSGIPDVWLTGWLQSHFGTRTKPFRVIGPVGAKVLMENLERAYALDIKIRIADEKLPPEGVAVEVEEFDRDGVIFEKNGVKVIAFEVDHGDVIKPAYGYRIEYAGRVAVISGDTRYNANVIKYGAGADLLVHEVACARPELMQERLHPAHRRAPCHAARGRPRLRAGQAEARGLHALRHARQRANTSAHSRRPSGRDPSRPMTAPSNWARISCRSRSARPSPSAAASDRIALPR